MYRTSITLVRSIRVSLQQNASNSTFKRPKPIPDSVVNDDTHVKSRLAENRPLSSKEWTEIRSGIIAKDSFINEVNVDATILARCLPAAQLEVGKSYVGFLRDQGIEPNLATVGKLLRLYHASEKALTEVDKEDIVKICHQLQTEFSAYDANTGESMLHALVTTNEWRQSLSLLDTIKLTAKPSTSAYSTLIARSFTEKDTELGWKLLIECVESDKQPKCEVFIAYIRMCAQLHASDNLNACEEAITRLLKFIGHHSLIVSRSVIEELQQVLNHSETTRCQQVTIGEKGKCPSCNIELLSVFLTHKEFKELSNTFLDKVLVQKDAFLKSSPVEVDKFERFLRSQPPFHCVIDGLNVAFSTGLKSPSGYAKLLTAVVRYFVDQKKRVLVLGRRHMMKWPKNHMSFVHNNAKIFLTDDLSHDDPFLLYATLKSGPNTDFVSRDLMRGHAHLLGPELKATFRRWQQEHQYYLELGSHAGLVNIREPLKYHTNAHTANGHWHVPFTDVYNANPPDTFDLPRSWLCIRPAENDK